MPERHIANPEIRLTSVTKRFPGVTALDDVSVVFRSGHVVGLIGENGAGKSTLTKVLAGTIPHSSFEGEVLVDGRAVAFSSPRDALDAGVVLVPQELSLHPQLTVAENVMVGRWPMSRFRTIAWREVSRQAERFLAMVGLDRPADSALNVLSPSEQQLVAIARGLAREARLLLLDEPSAALDSPEAARLLTIVRTLAGAGVAIAYISHRIDEVFAVCDSIVVLRNGLVVLDTPTAATDQSTVVSVMLGQSPEPTAEIERRSPTERSPILEGKITLEDPIRPGRNRLESVEVVLRPGEIVGLVGLVGSGRTELLWSLFGALPRRGTVRVAGREIRPRPWESINAGIGMVTEERRATGLFGLDSVARNVVVASLRRAAGALGLVKVSVEEALANEAVDTLGIKTASIASPVATLSGGNQQKTILGRWIVRDTRILLLDEPARGIDVGSRTEIYALLRRLAQERDLAILTTSSDVSELVGVCDRFLVLREGRLVAEVDADATEHRLLQLAGGFASGGGESDGAGVG